MKFVAISDTHGLHRQLSLPKGDVIVHAGDFCNFGNERDMGDFLIWFRGLNFRYKILIGGNHDFFAAEEPEQFNQVLGEGITYLNDSGTRIEGIHIWGSPVQPDLVGWAFGKNRGGEMKSHWDLIPEDTDLLVTHCPPFGILDRNYLGEAIGCEELRDRIQALHVKAHVFGHIHESYGQLEIGNTRFFNVASMKSSFGLINSPVVFEV